MDYIVTYPNVNNVHCVIQEKDVIIERQQKEIEELKKTNQLLIKDNEKLKNDYDLQKKLNEALENFKYSLEREIQVLKNKDNNKWSTSDAESEVKIWEHEYLMVRRMIEKKEKEESLAAAGVHNQNKPNQTSQKPKNVSNKRSAAKHKVADGTGQTAIKKYVCDYPSCNYRSNWAHDLKGHKRKHTGERPYTCSWLNCNKSFRDLRDLKRHQRAHTGDKKYSCDWPGCEYRSTDVANLAKHKRTHTGEKPYKCSWEGCNACFADGSHLKRHQNKHENQINKMSKTGSKNKKKTCINKNRNVKTRQQPARKSKSSFVEEIDFNAESIALSQNDMIDGRNIHEQNSQMKISQVDSNKVDSNLILDNNECCVLDDQIDENLANEIITSDKH